MPVNFVQPLGHTQLMRIMPASSRVGSTNAAAGFPRLSSAANPGPVKASVQLKSFLLVVFQDNEIWLKRRVDRYSQRADMIS